MLLRFLCVLAVLPISVATAASLTITNQNVALVRENLSLDLVSGENTVTHTPLTTDLNPESILLLPKNGGDFEILEQSFETNTPTQDNLLRAHSGKELQFLVKESEKPDRIVTARILAADGQKSIIELDRTVRFGLPGQPLFPPLPDGTRLTPTIVWTLSAGKSISTNATLAYLASGFDWTADYSLVERGDDGLVDLNARVAITNGSIHTLEASTIKLMAGDVAVSQPRRIAREGNRIMAMAAMDSAAPEISRQSFEDLHLYTLPRPVTLSPGEVKQVEFASATGVTSRRIYIYDPQADFVPRHYGGDTIQRLTSEDFGGQAGTRIDVFREIENTPTNGLGIPLPTGSVRFYRMDGADLEFTGERTIGHTAAGETLRLATGAAFDLVGKRVRRDLKIDTSNKTTTEKIEITLRNRKESDVTIQVLERLARGTNWDIPESSTPFERLDNNRIQFDVPVAAGSEATVTYTVHFSW